MSIEQTLELILQELKKLNNNLSIIPKVYPDINKQYYIPFSPYVQPPEFKLTETNLPRPDLTPMCNVAEDDYGVK